MNPNKSENKGLESGLGKSILNDLKLNGASVIGILARKFRVTVEAIRQQLAGMEKNGFVEREILRSGSPKAGRPRLTYKLTDAGEDIFPKNYPALSIALIDAVHKDYGNQGLINVLDSISESQVEKWTPLLSGKTMEQKLTLLKNMYQKGDAFTSVEKDGKDFLLVEKNCPYYQVAKHRPQLCSLTLNTLSRLLGYKVMREKKFQEGHGKCVFRVSRTQPFRRDSKYYLEESSN